jgi:hypothetical protein
VYPHDRADGFDVDCLPDELQGTIYFEPSGIGDEQPVERRATGRPREPESGRS